MSISPAELEAMKEAARRAVADAPPIPPHVIEMLRRDRCPIFGRQRQEGAA